MIRLKSLKSILNEQYCNLLHHHYVSNPYLAKTTLPREWEQKLQQKGLELSIFWHNILTSDEEFKKKREKMVKIWRGVKRNMDTSLTCLYLKYAFRQVSEDINQLALELNLESMHKTLDMLKSAEKRIAKFKSSDNEAIKKIEEALEIREA